MVGWLLGWLVDCLVCCLGGRSVGQLFQLLHIKFFDVYFTSAVIPMKSIIITIVYFNQCMILIIIISLSIILK